MRHGSVHHDRRNLHVYGRAHHHGPHDNHGLDAHLRYAHHGLCGSIDSRRDPHRFPILPAPLALRSAPP